MAFAGQRPLIIDSINFLPERVEIYYHERSVDIYQGGRRRKVVTTNLTFLLPDLFPEEVEEIQEAAYCLLEVALAHERRYQGAALGQEIDDDNNGDD